MGRVARVALAILILVLLVVVIGGLIGREAPRGPSPTSPAIPTSTSPTTTTLPTSTTTSPAAPLVPVLPSMDEPFFTASLDAVAIIVPQGGGFRTGVVFEGHNGFSGNVAIEVAGVWYHTGDIGVGAHLLKPGVVNVSLSESSVSVPGRVTVEANLSPKAPPGKYTVVLVARGGGLTYTVLVPFRVYAYPSYLIRPLPAEPVVRVGDWAEITLSVEPLGPFNRTVKLSARPSTGMLEVQMLGGEGVPPFNATLKVRVAEDLWARAIEENVTTNSGLYVTITGTPRGPQAVVMLGLEPPPREPGLLATLLGIITLPVRIVTGLTLGLIMEFAYAPILPTVPRGALLTAGLTLTLPELAATQERLPTGFEGASLSQGNHWTSFVKLGIVSSSKPASILTPSALVPLQPGQAARVPLIIYVDNPETVEVRAWAEWQVTQIFPPMKKTYTKPLNLSIEAGPRMLRGFIEIPAEGPRGDRILVEVRDRATGRLLDKVVIATRTYTPAQTLVAVARPGETLVVPMQGLPDLRRVKPIDWLTQSSPGNLTFLRPQPPLKPLEGVAEALLYQSLPPDKMVPVEQVLSLEIKRYGNETSILLIRVRPGIEPGVYSTRTYEVVTAEGKYGGACVFHLVVQG